MTSPTFRLTQAFVTIHASYPEPPAAIVLDMITSRTRRMGSNNIPFIISLVVIAIFPFIFEGPSHALVTPFSARGSGRPGAEMR